MRYIVALFCTLSSFQLSASASLAKRTIYATQSGGMVRFKDQSVRTEEMATAIRKARPGDRVLLLPGTYTKMLDVQKSAPLEEPIYVQGVDGLTSFACNDLPSSQGEPALKISASQGLIFSGLRFENCWPRAVEISDSQFIDIRDSEFIGSQTAIKISERNTHHLQIIGNRWSQFASEDIKNAPSDTFVSGAKYADYAGSFIELNKVGGDILIAENMIANGFGLLRSLGLEKPWPATKRIYLRSNKNEFFKHSAISLSGHHEPVLIDQNEFLISDSLITASADFSGKILMVANKVNRVSTSQSPLIDSAPVASAVEILIAGNHISCPQVIFAPLLSGYKLSVYDNEIHLCQAGRPLFGADTFKLFRILDGQSYYDQDPRPDHKKFKFDLSSEFFSQADSKSKRTFRLRPGDLVEILFHGPPELARKLFSKAPTDYDAPAMIQTPYAMRGAMIWPLDRAMSKKIEAINLKVQLKSAEQPQSLPCQIVDRTQIVCQKVDDGMISQATATWFEIVGPEESISARQMYPQMMRLEFVKKKVMDL